LDGLGTSVEDISSRFGWGFLDSLWLGFSDRGVSIWKCAYSVALHVGPRIECKVFGREAGGC
jgi:hypothetical protein